jgi:GNAT superfamily N-acetyltransferase
MVARKYKAEILTGKNKKMIRRARVEDASRIAEILIFTKRMNYRKIFNNDFVSFGKMQVYPLAKNYIDNPEKLEDIWVYDDAFVKGMIRIEGNQIAELYVDTFFENKGIGSVLIKFAVEQMNCNCLWVLEKNTKAIEFYERHGFKHTEKKQFEEGISEYIIQMVR